MNDESKKLKLFEKEWALVEHTYAPGSRDAARAGWLGGFDEVLRIVDDAAKCPICGIHAIDYVRASILDELGMAGDERDTAKETNSAKIINKTKSDFIKHIEKVSKIVETWPEWEQTILGVASRESHDAGKDALCMHQNLILGKSSDGPVYICKECGERPTINKPGE